MDSNLRSYLAILIVVVLYKLGDTIWVPKKINVIDLIEKEFEHFLAYSGAKIYDSYSTLIKDYHLHELPKEPLD